MVELQKRINAISYGLKAQCDFLKGPANNQGNKFYAKNHKIKFSKL